MKKLLLTIGLLAAVGCYGQRRDEYYVFGAGLRAGVKSGLTLKYFATDHFAIEAIAGYEHKGVEATVLAERHFYLFATEALSYYCGAGAHISGDAAHDNWKTPDGIVYRDGNTAYGADLITGLEFKFPVMPIAINLDFKPFVEFSSEGGYFCALDTGIGVRLAL